MPMTKAPWGGEFFAPSREEYVTMIADAEEIRQRARARAWKHMHLPEVLYGNVANSGITLGAASSGQILGPEPGYAWIIYALIVTGLTGSATTPDIVNFYLNDRFSGPIWWQLNGNQFGQTFSTYQRVLLGGDTLSLQNSGSLAATGRIIVSGEITEVPAEELVKGRGD